MLLPRLPEQRPLAQPVAGAHQRNAQQHGGQRGGGAGARGGGWGGDLPCSRRRLRAGAVVRWDEQGVDLGLGLDWKRPTVTMFLQPELVWFSGATQRSKLAPIRVAPWHAPLQPASNSLLLPY